MEDLENLQVGGAGGDPLPDVAAGRGLGLNGDDTSVVGDGVGGVAGGTGLEDDGLQDAVVHGLGAL